MCKRDNRKQKLSKIGEWACRKHGESKEMRGILVTLRECREERTDIKCEQS